MKRLLRVIAILLMLASLLVLVPSGAIVAQAEVIELELTAKAGQKPLPEGYLSDWEYEDPSISVKIEKGRIYETDYVVARVKLTNASIRSKAGKVIHTVYPMKIFISTQGGRQYLLCYHFRFRKLMFFRMDYIHAAELLDEEPNQEKYAEIFKKFQPHLWGTSGGAGFRVEHLEMTLSFEPGEEYIPRRLEREKRNGRVEILDDHTCRYITDVYDASELIPWLRTFIGRIIKLECSDHTVVEQFYSDLEKLAQVYGGDV
jgi:hypothetical protein